MKAKSTLFIFAILSLLTVSSCQKELSDDHVKYLGQWGSDKHSIEIWKNGRGVYQKQNQEPQECNVVIKSDQIKFKTGAILLKKFDILTDPYVDNSGNTVMILDHRVFYKH